ncbi:hypothetical protein HKD37_18G049830 [Glycine soja]
MELSIIYLIIKHTSSPLPKKMMVHSNRIEEVRMALGFYKAFMVDNQGRSGGLAMLWRSSVRGEMVTMLAAGFYGILDRAKRRDSWNLFRTLAANICFPWCVMGDFNDLLSNEDKCGRVEHPFWLMQGFQEAVGDCGLRDIVLEDYPFTWVKSKSIDSAVEERLDRGPWLINFPEARLLNLFASILDHTPIILHTEEEVWIRFRRSFMFENSWLNEKELEDVVLGGWSFNPNADVIAKLQNCASGLDSWGRILKSRFREDIDRCKKDLEYWRDKGDSYSVSQLCLCRKLIRTLVSFMLLHLKEEEKKQID